MTATRPSHSVLITRALQALLIVGMIAAAFRGNWLNVITVGLILFLIALPRLLGDRFKVVIPDEFIMLAAVFIFGSLFLGSFRDFYERFWWWDAALHTASGGLLGILGLMLVYSLNRDPNIKVTMSPFFVALFATCFAMAIGVVWEIYEFTVDQLLGWNMQRNGIVDTMWDLIVDTAGAAVVSVMGYAYLKSNRESVIARGLERFVEQNPDMFGE